VMIEIKRSCDGVERFEETSKERRRKKGLVASASYFFFRGKNNTGYRCEPMKLASCSFAFLAKRFACYSAATAAAADGFC